ncbi:MAG: hypothetical protein RLZZ214_601 [Verrucomicrobiota bacterium]|jgi:hypothetical protein
MKSPGQPIAIVCAFAWGVCGARSAGVAAIKEQTFHRDSSAKAVVYSRIIDSRGPYLRLVSGGVNIDITRSKMVARIEMPDGIPESIMEEEDIAPLRETLADVRAFATRYPSSARLMAQQIAALDSYVSRFEAGDVRHEGAWMSRNQFAGIEETRRREAAAVARAEVEKRVFEAGQRDKGLMLSDSKWMTKVETERRPPEAPTELSDSIEPLWNGDLDAARFAVKNLAILAARQTGAPKVRTERLMSAVRNLFQAETNLTNQIIARAGEAHEAAKHDRNAKKWLIPNAFGTIHKDASRDSLRKAAEIRQQSADALAARRRELREQLREIETVSADFQKLREQRVALILGAAARAVTARHFTEAELRPAEADDSLASVREPVPPEDDSSSTR